MTNKEKMLAGQVYDPNDEELVSEQFEYLNAMKAYNALPYGCLLYTSDAADD